MNSEPELQRCFGAPVCRARKGVPTREADANCGRPTIIKLGRAPAFVSRLSASFAPTSAIESCPAGREMRRWTQVGEACFRRHCARHAAGTRQLPAPPDCSRPALRLGRRAAGARVLFTISAIDWSRGRLACVAR